MAQKLQLTYAGHDVVDGDYPDELRNINHHFNDKTTVLEQVQKLFFNLRARLGMQLDIEADRTEQEATHRYALSQDNAPRISVAFRARSALCPNACRRSASPQSIGQFNRFLEKLNAQVEAPYNAAFTDALRILTVCNEGEFQIDSYSDDGESVLVLNSSRLRQSIEFVVAH